MHVISTSLTRYRVEGPVGIGPDGPVQRATAERLGARPVALRRLHVPAGPDRVRLRRDAEVVATLGNPALAVVTDVLEVDDRTVLLASELGPHGSLEDRLVRGHLPVDEAIAVVRTLADALVAAHGVGLVHGRVTARNVVLTAGGPLLTDLAQAAALGRSATPADDAAALVHLAARLVDGADRSPRAMAYRAVCRFCLESDTGLSGVLAALDRLDQAAAPESTTHDPTPVAQGAAGEDSAVVGIAIAVSLAVGAAIGAAGTLLPVLAG